MSKSSSRWAEGSGLDESVAPSTCRVTQSSAVAPRNSAVLTHAPVAAAEVAAWIARYACERGEADGLDPQRVHNLLHRRHVAHFRFAADGLDPQRVHNLLFLCQGYSLAAHGRPLFAGRLLASPGGVSCPYAADPREDQQAGDSPDEVREVVAHVWQKFGGLTPPRLQTRVQGHVWCVQEMAGGGPDLSADPEALGKAFRLAAQEGLI